MSLTQDKYDRQTRLWGQHGQSRLTNASICLIGCDPAGVETLKNLVLPGVGHITIIDNKMISNEDTLNNFYTPYSRIGEPRAKVVLELLLELNSDVRGVWAMEINLQQQEFDLIIVNETEIAYHQTNIIHIQTFGLIGKLRVYAPKCNVIEAKPMGERLDLRIADPFPEFQQFSDSIQLDSNVEDIAHIPYIVILRKALQQFQATYNKYPTTFNEKNVVFKGIIVKMSELIPCEYRGNFMEAIQNMQHAFRNDDWALALENINVQDNDVFHLLCHTAKEFVKVHGLPPLKRKFPDMECKSATYLLLKNEIYGNKSDRDFEEFKYILSKLANGIIVDDDTIRLFIENIENIRSLTYRTLATEDDMPLKVTDTESNNYQWYAAFRAVNQYYKQKNCYPTLKDLNEFEQFTLQECNRLGIDALSDGINHEMCRHQGSHLNMIGSVMGGIASQEAIKLITQQFIPINNTLIYDGITGEAAVYEF